LRATDEEQVPVCTIVIHLIDSGTLRRDLLEVDRVPERDVHVTCTIMSKFLEKQITCYDFVTVTVNGGLEINICQLGNWTRESEHAATGVQYIYSIKRLFVLLINLNSAELEIKK